MTCKMLRTMASNDNY